MITKSPALTGAGTSMLIRAISGGEQLTFTKFKIGNGNEGNISTITDLSNPLVDFGIIDIDKSNPGFCKIVGKFSDADIDSDFQLREFGLFAKIGDEEELLYAYAYDGNNAGMLKAHGSEVTCEQTVSMIIAVGEAEHVTAILSESALFASKEEFDSHVNNTGNPHNVTAQHIGLDNVPNVSTNDQTPTYTAAKTLSNLSSGEKMSTAFGKIAKAVSSLISHLTNTSNPHGVTISQISAAAASHSHSTADITTGTLSATRGGTGSTSIEAAAKSFINKYLDGGIKDVSASQDCNNLKTPGIYNCWVNNPTSKHYPGDANWLVIVFRPEYMEDIFQIAIRISTTGSTYKVYDRSYSGGSWSAWEH
ncbi:MAG: hypothetical protein ACI4F5_06565 [Acutalibacteraceae bacterium]